MVSSQIRTLIQMALAEDFGRGDISALAVPRNAQAKAEIIAKDSAIIVSGLWLVPEILSHFSVSAQLHSQDGSSCTKGQKILSLQGSAREILGLERTLLNFLQRLSGIATLAQKYKQAVANISGASPHLRLLDTRKTTPGFRELEKRAVRDGGLQNHRFSLDTGILLKENHLRAAGGLRSAIIAMQEHAPSGMEIEVEVTNLAEANTAAALGIRSLLLDNFSVEEMRAAVKILRLEFPQIILEASGGINLQTIAAYAGTGVDAISIGALTHSAPAADLSLLFTPLENIHAL